jgi:hypothetical protein
MFLRIFMPTPRRLLLFFIFLVLTVSGAMAIVPPFQNLFGFPYLLFPGYSGVAAQIIYSYIVACIYAFAYVRLEASIRRSYPNMNDRLRKHAPEAETPSGENALAEPEPAHTVQVVHPAHPARKPVQAKARARTKKAAKKRKR